MLQGFVELAPHFDENLVREALVKTFRRKFPLMENSYFDFVKRETNMISVPVIDDSFKWNYDSIKALMGQGKLCCRLSISLRSLLGNTSDIQSEDDDGKENLKQCLPPLPPIVDNQNDQLEETPNKPGTSTRIEELQSFIHELLEKQDESANNSEIIAKPTNFLEAVELLKVKMIGEEVKLKVDEEDALVDALAYYKDKQFNENSPLKIKFRNQPAVDTGGVLRQFYTVVFEQMLIGTDDMPPLFEGKQGRKVPIYNAGVIVSNVMCLIGKMMSHSIVQVGIGPACFSPPIFYYFVSGDFNQVIPKLSVDDTTAKTRYYVDMVCIYIYIYTII